MTNSAKTFWNNPLEEVKTLCDRTFSYFVEAEDDMKKLYHEDLVGFEAAMELFKRSDAEALATLVSEMDTEPREQIVLAFNKDCGPVFTLEILGYEVA
tara:strand:+ start:571 stop:864 length:294 start_codon:yes stop_codon:yes gene_type:complete